MIRILYVDDEPDIREVAALAMGLDPEFSVECSASGADALVKAATAPPDAILLDVMMPEMDGMTTLRRLREQPETAAVPVIFVTAQTQEHDMEAYRRCGAQGVIAKPFNPIALAQQVRELLP